MACLVYLKRKVPTGVVPAREHADFQSFIDNAAAVSAKYNLSFHYWELADLPEDFFGAGTTKEEQVLEWEIAQCTLVPNNADLTAIRAEVSAHALDSAVRQHNADNGVIVRRKVVDFATGAIITDWEPV